MTDDEIAIGSMMAKIREQHAQIIELRHALRVLEDHTRWTERDLFIGGVAFSMRFRGEMYVTMRPVDDLPPDGRPTWECDKKNRLGYIEWGVNPCSSFGEICR